MEGCLIKKNFHFNFEKINYLSLGDKNNLNEILNAVIFQFYSLNNNVPDKILIPSTCKIDPNVLDFLTEKKGEKNLMLSPMQLVYTKIF